MFEKKGKTKEIDLVIWGSNEKGHGAFVYVRLLVYFRNHQEMIALLFFFFFFNLPSKVVLVLRLQSGKKRVLV